MQLEHWEETIRHRRVIPWTPHSQLVSSELDAIQRHHRGGLCNRAHLDERVPSLYLRRDDGVALYGSIVQVGRSERRVKKVRDEIARDTVLGEIANIDEPCGAGRLPRLGDTEVRAGEARLPVPCEGAHRRHLRGHEPRLGPVEMIRGVARLDKG